MFVEILGDRSCWYPVWDSQARGRYVVGGCGVLAVVIRDSGTRGYIVQAMTGDVKGKFAWAHHTMLRVVSPLELLAMEAE